MNSALGKHDKHPEMTVLPLFAVDVPTFLCSLRSKDMSLVIHSLGPTRDIGATGLY